MNSKLRRVSSRGSKLFTSGSRFSTFELKLVYVVIRTVLRFFITPLKHVEPKVALMFVCTRMSLRNAQGLSLMHYMTESPFLCTWALKHLILSRCALNITERRCSWLVDASLAFPFCTPAEEGFLSLKDTYAWNAVYLWTCVLAYAFVFCIHKACWNAVSHYIQ